MNSVQVPVIVHRLLGGGVKLVDPGVARFELMVSRGWWTPVEAARLPVETVEGDGAAVVSEGGTVGAVEAD